MIYARFCQLDNFSRMRIPTDFFKITHYKHTIAITREENASCPPADDFEWRALKCDHGHVALFQCKVPTYGFIYNLFRKKLIKIVTQTPKACNNTHFTQNVVFLLHRDEMMLIF